MLEKLRKVFTKTPISWRNLLIFSSLIGVFVGILARIPLFHDTSFEDPAVVFDIWIVLAIFIIANAKSRKEAVSKCFVFFLISQPLIYLTEIIISTLFSGANFADLFVLYFRNYYIGAGWLLWTFLTIPGAFAAYEIKKNDLASIAVLSVATVFLGFTGITRLFESISGDFPRHVLSSLFCLISAYLLIFIILKFRDKKKYLLPIMLTTISIVIGIVDFFTNTNSPISASYDLELEEGIIVVEAYSEDENIATVRLDGDSVIASSSNSVGETKITLIDDSGVKYTYLVKSSSRDFSAERNY